MSDPFPTSFEGYFQQEESPFGYFLLEGDTGGRLLLEESVQPDTMYGENDAALIGSPFATTSGFSGSPFRSTS